MVSPDLQRYDQAKGGDVLSGPGARLENSVSRIARFAGLSCSKIVSSYRGNDRADRSLSLFQTVSRT
jgi:hypothetical protein